MMKGKETCYKLYFFHIINGILTEVILSFQPILIKPAAARIIAWNCPKSSNFFSLVFKLPLILCTFKCGYFLAN